VEEKEESDDVSSHSIVLYVFSWPNTLFHVSLWFPYKCHHCLVLF
jgi:hypothetical protein